MSRDTHSPFPRRGTQVAEPAPRICHVPSIRPSGVRAPHEGVSLWLTPDHANELVLARLDGLLAARPALAIPRVRGRLRGLRRGPF